MTVTNRQARGWLRKARSAAARACGSANDPNWWPKSQGVRTALSWAVALEWTRCAGLGHARSPIWISSCRGKEWETKEKLLQDARYNVSVPSESKHLPYAPNGARRFDARQYLVDFSVWPHGSRTTQTDVHLMMESEMCADYPVGDEVIPNNGYAYDFYKLIWLPSPRRLFVCTVRDEANRQTLIQSLAKITTDSIKYLRTDDLLVYVLPTRSCEAALSKICVWDHENGRFNESSLG